MKAQLVARKRILDPETNELLDDEKLLALDGIMYGPVHEMEGIEDYDEMVKEFEELYPDFRSADYKIEIQ